MIIRKTVWNPLRSHKEIRVDNVRVTIRLHAAYQEPTRSLAEKPWRQQVTPGDVWVFSRVFASCRGFFVFVSCLFRISHIVLGNLSSVCSPQLFRFKALQMYVHLT